MFFLDGCFQKEQEEFIFFLWSIGVQDRYWDIMFWMGRSFFFRKLYESSFRIILGWSQSRIYKVMGIRGKQVWGCRGVLCCRFLVSSLGLRVVLRWLGVGSVVQGMGVNLQVWVVRVVDVFKIGRFLGLILFFSGS